MSCVCMFCPCNLLFRQDKRLPKLRKKLDWGINRIGSLKLACRTELSLHWTEECGMFLTIFSAQNAAASEQLSLCCELDCSPSAAATRLDVENFRQASGTTSTFRNVTCYSYILKWPSVVSGSLDTFNSLDYLEDRYLKKIKQKKKTLDPSKTQLHVWVKLWVRLVVAGWEEDFVINGKGSTVGQEEFKKQLRLDLTVTFCENSHKQLRPAGSSE